MPDHRTPTRRQLLAAAAVVAGTAAVGGPALSGCAAGAGQPAAAPSGDTALARRTARESAELLAAYRATLRRHARLGQVLRPLAAHHREHLAVLAPVDPPRIGAMRVPGAERAALAMLQRQEQALAGSRRSATVDAESGDLARILAAVVACQAQHLVLLDAQLRGGSR